jgi:uncharacterized protein (DUF2141 family)
MLFKFVKIGWIFASSKQTNTMKNFTTSLLILLLSLTNAFSQDATKQDVVVKIVNFDTSKGKVLIGLYNSENTFMEVDFRSSISKIEHNECTVTFKNVPIGTYGMSLFHDENDNGKMDINMFGVPKEDYAFSNNAKGFMGPPKWDAAKFEVLNKTVNQTIKL